MATLSFNAVASATSLTIVYPNEKNAFHDAAAEIVRAAYKEIGIDVVYKTYPAERALQLSNKGISDGELVRIEGIEAKYPNLIRIPVSHVTAEQMAFGTDASVRISGWPGLKGKRIAFHRGYKVAESNTIGMNRHIVSSDTAAFKMLSAGRMEIAIANRFSGQKMIRELGLKNVVMLVPPLQANPLFHYLHKKHAALVPKITAAMQRLKTSGQMAEILKKLKVPAPISVPGTSD